MAGHSDRRVIMLGTHPTQDGIAAALRRAFVAVQIPPEDDYFDRLLDRLA